MSSMKRCNHNTGLGRLGSYTDGTESAWQRLFRDKKASERRKSSLGSPHRRQQHPHTTRHSPTDCSDCAHCQHCPQCPHSPHSPRCRHCPRCPHCPGCPAPMLHFPYRQEIEVIGRNQVELHRLPHAINTRANLVPQVAAPNLSICEVPLKGF